jgi:K+-transporting ATPase KdpF subunit
LAMQDLAVGILAALCVIYLIIAVLRPEKF